MFQNSQDLLNVVLAFSILWVAIFLSLALFYVILTLRAAHKVINDIRDKTHRLQRSFEALCGKLEKSAALIPLAFESIKQIVKFLLEKREEKKKKKV